MAVTSLPEILGEKATPAIFQLVDDRFVQAGFPPFSLLDILDASASSANLEILRWGLEKDPSILQHEETGMELLKAAISSGKETTVRAVAQLLKIPLDVAHLQGVKLERLKGTAEELCMLWLIEDYGMEPSQEALIDALWQDKAGVVRVLLNYSAPPPSLQEFAFLYHSPSLRRTFELFLSHPRVGGQLRIEQGNFIQAYGYRECSFPFLAEKGLFDPGLVDFVCADCHPDVFLFLRDRGIKVCILAFLAPVLAMSTFPLG